MNAFRKALWHHAQNLTKCTQDFQELVITRPSLKNRSHAQNYHPEARHRNMLGANLSIHSTMVDTESILQSYRVWGASCCCKGVAFMQPMQI